MEPERPRPRPAATAPPATGGGGGSSAPGVCGGGGGGGGGGGFGGGGAANGSGGSASGGGGGGGSSAFAAGVTAPTSAVDAGGTPSVQLVYNDPAAAETKGFTFGALTKDKAKGRATQVVTVPSAGTITLAGNGVKPQTVPAAAASSVDVLIKATGTKKQKLKRKGKVKVDAAFTFAPTGGTPSTQTITVKLKRTR